MSVGKAHLDVTNRQLLLPGSQSLLEDVARDVHGLVLCSGASLLLYLSGFPHVRCACLHYLSKRRGITAPTGITTWDTRRSIETTITAVARHVPNGEVPPPSRRIEASSVSNSSVQRGKSPLISVQFESQLIIQSTVTIPSPFPRPSKWSRTAQTHW